MIPRRREGDRSVKLIPQGAAAGDLVVAVVVEEAAGAAVEVVEAAGAAGAADPVEPET